MKIQFIVLSLLLAISATAQKKVVVKKGDIKVDGALVATYDGKGGNAFRMGKFEIKLPGASTAAITLKEDAIYFKNPLFDEVYWIYEIKFSDGEVLYYRALPVTKKFMGNVITTNSRKTGDDIIDELFNDETPVFVTAAGLSKENIAAFKSSPKFYNKEKIMAEVKQAEDAIAGILKVNVDRDKSKPVNLLSEPKKDDLGSWFSISQGDKIIGKVYKRTGNGFFYQVWKKAPAGFKIGDKEYEFVPIALTENLSDGNGAISKKSDAIMVVGKSTFQFPTPDMANAERELINALIAAGNL